MVRGINPLSPGLFPKHGLGFVCEEIDELTDVVSSYISFCEASIIPRKEIFFYPNNKPWVTKSVKTIINQKNICFTQGDTARYRELQKQLKKELKLAKCRYKDKVESMLRAGSSRPAWEGVKSMMGMQPKKSHVSLNGRPDLVLSNDLNNFYNRFNVCDFSDELSAFKNVVSTQSSSVVVDRIKVCQLFRGVKERKSPGPDGIGGRVLKNCADQLADIFTFIFSSQDPLTLEGFHYCSCSQICIPQITK